jgi:hypothetical protein
MNLTHGQLVWAVGYGRDPDQVLKDQIRYLRLLGIPPTVNAKASGSGKRIRYDFYDLVELGLAVTALGLGSRPKDFAAVLAGNREAMRKVYADAWRELPDEAIKADWVQSRGQSNVMLGDEKYIRLHDRRSSEWGKFDVVGPEDVGPNLGILEPIERFANEPPRRVLPLKRLMLQWAAWALEAPDIKPGRR